MEPSTEEAPAKWLTTTRLESLIDNIFAFSMTIMALNIVVPALPQTMSLYAIKEMLSQLMPHIISFVISFLILSVMWMKHHKMFAIIERVDRPLLWINIFIAMGIVLLPFSTQLSAIHNGKQLAEVAFILNLLFIGLLYNLCWIYATWNRHLIPRSLTDERIKYIKGKMLVVPVICFAALALSFVDPALSSTIFVVVPVILFNFLV